MDAEKHTEQVLLRRLSAEMDDAVERQGSETRAALARARHRALEAGVRHRYSFDWLWWNLGGAATAMGLALVFVLAMPGDPGDLSVADIDLALSADDPELVQDLAFYNWLDYQEDRSEAL